MSVVLQIPGALMTSEIYDYAIKLLAKKDYFRAELEKKLNSKFTGRSYEVSSVINRLLELKYLNDDQLLEKYVKSKFEMGWGSLLIRQKLYEKGLSVDISVIDNLAEYSDETRIKKLFKDKFLKYKNNEKTVAYFCRKGYSYGYIKKVLSEVVQNESDFS